MTLLGCMRYDPKNLRAELGITIRNLINKISDCLFAERILQLSVLSQFLHNVQNWIDQILNSIL